MRGIGLRLVLIAALVAAPAAGSAACWPHKGVTTPATAPQDIAAMNRVLAGRALDIITDVAKIGAQVRITVRGMRIPPEKRAAFEQKYAAYQAVMDRVIEEIRAQSKATDPVLTRIGEAARSVAPAVLELTGFVRTLDPPPPPSVTATVDAFEAVLDAVISFGKS